MCRLRTAYNFSCVILLGINPWDGSLATGVVSAIAEHLQDLKLPHLPLPGCNCIVQFHRATPFTKPDSCPIPFPFPN